MLCWKCMNEYTGYRCPKCGFDSESYEPVPTALHPGTVLNERYLLGAVLGKGGFGITYIGYDNMLRQKVAVKEFFPSSVAYRDSNRTKEISLQSSDMAQVYSNGVRKFYDEAVTMSKLRNIPSIVGIFDFFYENNTAYIVMEYIDGTAVDKIVMNQGGLDIDMTLTIYYPIIQALKRVHSAGILHRDISPSNIMLDDKFRARLIDFGSSRAYSHEMSTDLTVILKKGFAAAEQYTRRGKHGPAEDVYSLCASMYYTLTGKVPPAAPDRRVFDTLQPIRSMGVDIPENIEKIIMKGMAVNEVDRYSDMEELSNAIDAAVMGEAPPEIETVKERIEKGHGAERARKISPVPDPQIALLMGAGVIFVLLVVILLVLLLKG
ncbi:MAG: serine/threonine protein kinase [Ruminococcaceae bacterium]|nr:serine/threonine protein kinase [Oscillospiraceae bacterium]